MSDGCVSPANPGDCNHELCVLCGSAEPLVVIDGGRNCYSCGGIIVLCAACASHVASELVRYLPVQDASP